MLVIVEGDVFCKCLINLKSVLFYKSSVTRPGNEPKKCKGKQRISLHPERKHEGVANYYGEPSSLEEVESAFEDQQQDALDHHEKDPSHDVGGHACNQGKDLLCVLA